MKLMFSKSRASTVNLSPNPLPPCHRRSITTSTNESTVRWSSVPTSPSSDRVTARNHSGPYRTASGSNHREAERRSVGIRTRSHAAARAVNRHGRAFTRAWRALPCTATSPRSSHTRRRTRSRWGRDTRSRSTWTARSCSAACAEIRYTMGRWTRRW